MQRPARRRVTARLAAASVVALALGACTDGSWFSSAEEEVDQPSSQPDTPADVATDPPGARALDLSWEEECRWLGVDLEDPPATAPELVELHLEMLPDHLEELYTRSPRSDDRLPGAYRIDGQGPLLRMDDPGIRFRGHSARGMPKKSFNLRFLDDLPGLGAHRVNLNAMYTDPSFVREHLAMRMLRTAGLAAPRTEYVDLYLNDTFEGLYVFVQRVDERLLDDHGLPSERVSLVRDRTRQGIGENVSLFSGLDLPFDDRDALVAELVELFDSRGDPDWQAVADLVEWVYEAGDDAQDAAGPDRWLDLGNVVDWHAMHVLIGDQDAFTDDYWLYQPEADAPWQIIPWDKDLSFGTYFVREHGGVANHLFHYEWDPFERAVSNNDLLRRVFESAEVQSAFDARLRELLESFDLAYACAELAATVPVIADSARRTPDDGFDRHEANHFADPGDHDLHVARVLDFLQLRAAYLQRYLDPVDGDVDTASTTISHADVGSSVLFTDAAGWTIARLDVFEVLEDGELRATIAESDRSPDVDREWRFSGDAHVRGHLNLYYRNTVAFGDWYRADDEMEAVGEQADLQIVEVAGERAEIHPSAANPYANRVAAEVVVRDGATFVLELGQDPR